MVRRATVIIGVLVIVATAFALGAIPLQIQCVETVCANFSWTVSDKTVNFDASASGGVPPYTWEWQYGDGSFSFEQNPVHTYVAYGTYTVSLLVKDSPGTGLVPSEYTVRHDVVASGPAGEELVASWTSDVTLPSQTTVVKFSGSATGGATPYSWAWDIDGGGQFDDYLIQNPTHDYGVYGSWIVTLKVTDANGAFDKHTVSISLAPSQMSVGIDVIRQEGLTVEVEAVVSGGAQPYISYYWNFGDERGDSILTHVTYSYLADGTYTISLGVRDTAFQQKEAVLSVTVEAAGLPDTGKPLSIGFSVASRDGLIVGFKSGASGGVTPYTFSWDFGDKSTSTSQHPSHEFSEIGSYLVTLTVIDTNGTTKEFSKQIAVSTDFVLGENLVFAPLPIILLLVGMVLIALPLIKRVPIPGPPFVKVFLLGVGVVLLVVSMLIFGGKLAV